MNNPQGIGVLEHSGVPDPQGHRGASSVHSTPRRANVGQPPALVTSLSGLQFQGLSVPSSTGGYLSTPTTMNSPYFSAAPLSGLATTPLSGRPAQYNSAYNPQEWGPIAPSSSPVVGIGVMPPVNNAVQRVAARADMDTATPPPPYSPPRSQNRAGSQSPQVAMSSPIAGALSPPTTHQRDMSPAARPPPPPPPPPPPASGHQYSSPRPRPVSMIAPGGLELRNPRVSRYPAAAQQSVNTQFSPHADESTSNAFSSSAQSAIQPVVSPGRVSPEAYNITQDSDLVPPAARRAASTGDINPSTRAAFPDGISVIRSSGRWAPGMPLPPPPPGPPPRASPRIRQSTIDSPSNASATNHNRIRPPSTGTVLGSVPPTPAGWPIENSRANGTPESSRMGSQQTTITASPEQAPSSSRTSSETRGVSRQATHRTPSRPANSKELRERRIESRNGREADSQREAAAEESHTAWPSDLVLENPGGPGLIRRRTVTRSTPRSARSIPSPGQDSDGFPRSPFGKKTSSTASFSTPTMPRTTEQAQSPAFSPAVRSKPSTPQVEVGQGMSSKTTPNSLPQAQKEQGPGSGRGRPVSHLLHLPVDRSPSDAPLVPARAPSSVFTPPPSGCRDEAFFRNAERRYRDFLEKETDARTDSEAMDIFCDFISSESRIRRQRYASVWENGFFNQEEFEGKLFTAPSTSEEECTVPELPSLSAGHPSGLWNTFKPVLSTIASMSISNEEKDSRGRPASRWWESQTGSDSGGNGQGLRRSKRESKYMGLPLREVMEQDYCTSPLAENASAYPNNPFLSYGPNEYPPEKVGWHEEAESSRAPARQLSLNRDALKLDISRLVTLPPPYPRHYPGVNNNHPDLGFYRSTVRSVTELSELREAYQTHQEKFKQLREEQQRRVQEERQDFRFRVNQAIDEGKITYAEAADAEAGRRAKENDKEKQLAQSEFDTYQEEVLRPMQSVLKDRINVVSACINELQEKLFESAEAENPDQAQEEGDERPELLEKLTQLKWLFEAREQLYREEYDLLSKCNEKFRIVVSLPYRQSNNREKLKEADNFFIRDAQNRQATFASETLTRFENFMSVIEANVSKGVETQLSAFWDIAPSLLAILQKVPEDLRGFSVKIPKKEYDENPSYYQHPLQYLYSLLSHAEKATYQFIESQTNLLCLLHEVKSGLMTSNCKSMEIQRINSGEPSETVSSEMRHILAEEEKVLTADLKEKVGVVESQWREALGTQLDSVKERVQGWLVEVGGWDDILLMEQT